MNTSNPFAGMFPGFDFMRQAASGVAVPPGLGSWIPTLDAKELDNRINELKTVLFWLEQNSAIVKSTMQALEVQKMTLGTLGAMNVGMAEMARAFTMPTPTTPATGMAPAGSWPFGSPVGGAAPQAQEKSSVKGKDAAADAGAAPSSSPQATLAASMAAPAQMWWNALAAQFQQLAGNVEQQQAAVEAAAEAAKARTAATAKAAAEVAEAAAEVAEAAAEVAEAAAAVQAKPRKRTAKAAEEKGGKDDKEEEKGEGKAAAKD